MNNYKGEPQIITQLELMHFGGLAKVLIPQETANGVLTIMASRCRLTTACLTPNLKICTLENLYDDFDRVSYIDIEEDSIPSLYPEEGVDFHTKHVAWADVIWNFAIYRSFEIWGKLSPAKLEKSLGKQLSSYARSSLKGKLGSANGKYIERENSEQWIFKKFRHTSVHKIFKPFSTRAIEICKQRARKSESY